MVSLLCVTVRWHTQAHKTRHIYDGSMDHGPCPAERSWHALHDLKLAITLITLHKYDLCELQSEEGTSTALWSCGFLTVFDCTTEQARSTSAVHDSNQ